MIRTWLWRALDAMAHVLYSPATLGRQGVWPSRWYHHVRLIPGRLFGAICDGYERRLAPLDEAELRWAYDWVDDPELSAAEILRRFRGLPPVGDEEDEFDALAAESEPVTVVGYAAPNGWTCEHVTMTAGGATLISAKAWCGCVMQPYYATTTR